MGKQKNAAKGGGEAPSSHSPTLSSHLGEAGDPYDAVQDLGDEVASLEETLSQMGTSSIYTMWWIAIRMVLIIGVPADPSANEDWIHYCIHVRVTLGEGRGDQPLPLHTWTGLLIADIF